jgi:hypothetical protein
MATRMTASMARFDLHTVELVCDLEGVSSPLAEAAALDWLVGERRIAAPSGLQEARLTVQAAGAEGLTLPAVMVDKAVVDGVRLRTGRDPYGRHVLVMDEAVCLQLLAGGSALATAAPDADRLRPALGDAVIFALDHALSSHGQCLAHAACLATPDGRGMVMLHAASGTGKTTTAMALALAGFGLSGDDTTALLAPAGDGPVMAWGLPRGAKLHRHSVAMLPALGDLVANDAWDAHGEQMVARPALRAAGLATPEGPLPLVGVVSLTRAEDAPAPYALQGPFDALDALMRDNISTHPGGFFPGHEARFDIFSSLVTTVRCLLVPVRGQPADVAATIARAFGY